MRTGAQLIPIGIPTVYWKTRPSNVTNMLSSRIKYVDDIRFRELLGRISLYLLGVKPLIHQSELRTYKKSSPFYRKKFLSLFCIVKNTEWNGIIKIENWSWIYKDYFEPKFYGFSFFLIPIWMIWCMTYQYWISVRRRSCFYSRCFP